MAMNDFINYTKSTKAWKESESWTYVTDFLGEIA